MKVEYKFEFFQTISNSYRMGGGLVRACATLAQVWIELSNCSKCEQKDHDSRAQLWKKN
jgi:hypothetical protein